MNHKTSLATHPAVRYLNTNQTASNCFLCNYREKAGYVKKIQAPCVLMSLSGAHLLRTPKILKDAGVPISPGSGLRETSAS